MRLIEVNPDFSYEEKLLESAIGDLAQAPEAWATSVKPSVQQAYAGIEVAKEAVVALETAATPEEYVEALAIAKAALDELAEAQNMANDASVRADETASEILPAIEGIEGPIDIKGFIRKAFNFVKSGAAKVGAAVKSVAQKVVRVAKKVGGAIVSGAKKLGSAVKSVFTKRGQTKAATAAAKGKTTGQSKAPITAKERAKVIEAKEQKKAITRKLWRQVRKEAITRKLQRQVREEEVVRPPEEWAPAPSLLVPEELFGAIGQVEPEKLPISVTLLRLILLPLKGLVQKFDELKATRNETKAALDRARAAMPQIKDPDWLTRYRAAEAAYAGNEKKYTALTSKVRGWVDWYKKVTKTEGEVGEIGSPVAWLIPLPVILAAIAGLSLLIGGLIGGFLTLKSQIPEVAAAAPAPIYVPPGQIPPPGATPIPGQPSYYYPAVAPEEKPLLEKWLGIKGGHIATAGVAIILIWGASKLVPPLLAKAKE